MQWPSTSWMVATWASCWPIFRCRPLSRACIAGVDKMYPRAAPDLDKPTTLVYMAMYDRASPYMLDIAVAVWNCRPTAEQAAVATVGALVPAQAAPLETPKQADITRLANETCKP